MAVTLTEAAATEIKRTLEDGNLADKFLRIGIVAGGCSGFEYSLTLDDSFDPSKDHMSEQMGVKVAVDKRSSLHLDGTVLDYHNGLEKRGFKFENPNVTKTCGCGSSFSA